MKLVPSPWLESPHGLCLTHSLASFAPRFGAVAADVRVRLILLGLSGTDTCYSSTSETIPGILLAPTCRGELGQTTYKRFQAN